MSTHLYCVLPHEVRGAIPLGLSGVEGERVRALPVDSLVAWVSDIAREIPLSVDGVSAHDAVVEAALETGSTPVPARFGQRFLDDDACRAAIVSRAASVESLLANMQGFVEMTLLITPSTHRMLADLEPVLVEMVKPDRPGGGRRYVETLRSREASTGAVSTTTGELAARLAHATRAFVCRSALHEKVTPLPLRTISHLIRRADVERYRQAVSGVVPNRDSRFLVIGPRAPYSFCALNDDAGGTHGMRLAD